MLEELREELEVLVVVPVSGFRGLGVKGVGVKGCRGLGV